MAHSMRAFRIAYDGRPFHGFQRQPDVRTVEDTLLGALRALDVCEEDTPPGYAAAGRTDAGVSARSQTVAFQCPAWLSPAAFNSELPAEIRAWSSAEARPAFHATHDALAREYTYHLHAPSTSVQRARKAVSELSGEADFHNFTPDETGTRRDLSGQVDAKGDWLVIRFRAEGFPRELVRRAVTVVKAVASGAADIDRIDRLLGPEPLDGPDGVAPAPPEPLVLTGVAYPSLSFEGDARAITQTEKIFDTRAVEHQVLARVSRTIADGVTDVE